MSQYILSRAFAIIAISALLPLHAQANQHEALNHCISTLATAGTIFVVTPVPPTHVVIMSKHVTLAFNYLQGAETLTRLLPQATQKTVFIDETVLTTTPESVLKVDQRIADCEKWAKQVYGNFSSSVRSEIYESALGRLKRIAPVKH